MKAPFSRTLADLLFEQAERYAAAPAVIGGDQRDVLRANLRTARAGVAAGLRDLRRAGAATASVC